MTKLNWTLTACAMSIFCSMRVVFGLSYLLLQDGDIPPAIRDFATVIPVRVWAVLWIIAGVAGLLTCVTRFTKFGLPALILLVALNVVWAIAYILSFIHGEMHDLASASTYVGQWALVAGIGMVIAIVRRRDLIRSERA